MPDAGELTMLYVHGENIGYARMGTMLAAALKDRGVDVYDSLGEGPDWAKTNPEVEARMTAQFGLDPMFERTTAAKQTNTVLWAATPSHASWWWKGQHPVLLTMWEATRLPEQFREQLHEFETLIVPSMHNVELFSKYHDDVQFCPLGVNPVDWHYTPRQMPTTRFNFLISGSLKRKGTDLAHAAFEKVFAGWKPSDGPEPHLVMKNIRGESFGGPRISMVTGRISARQEIDLYEEAHCYLQPSRGEGFGLMPLQAMAQGIPTILTGAHGHASFSDLGLPLSTTMTKSEYFIFGDAGEWWEPNFDELCEHMRDVYDNYEHHLMLAKMAAGVISHDFTWDAMARRTTEILGARIHTPYSGDGTWYLPERKLYETVTNKDWVADIGGTMYHFEKGVPVHTSADVKRVLFEANLLDMSCCEDVDSGLLPEQLAQAQKDNAKRSACATCGHVAGRSLGDEMVDQMEALAPWQAMVERLVDVLDDVYTSGVPMVGEEPLLDEARLLLTTV